MVNVFMDKTLDMTVKKVTKSYICANQHDLLLSHVVGTLVSSSELNNKVNPDYTGK